MKIAKILCASLIVLAGWTSAQATDAPADRGEYIARAGNCIACHSIPNAPPFSGGLKMATPLGPIYSTNITPDQKTGIGTYTREDFDRAMRLGIAKDGHRLYPAMPYPSYAKMTEEDMNALYDFFMKSVPPADVPNKPSEIPWPLHYRQPLVLWSLLFSDDQRYQPKPDRDAAWNRGAYLVQGLGHCGACHTPRGLAFNEKGYHEGDAKFLVGGTLDNWFASNLRQDGNTGLGRWTQEDLTLFLKTGHNRFSTAIGSMTEVINNSTQYMTDDDITAMATYLRSLPGGREKDANPYTYDAATAEKLKTRKFDSPGALTYVQQCITCHLADGKGYAPYLPPLAGNRVAADPDPVSLVNIVLNGSARVVVDGMPDAYRMPQYRVLLTDQEIAEVVTFVRTSWGNKATPVTAADVAKIRKITDPAGDQVHILRMK